MIVVKTNLPRMLFKSWAITVWPFIFVLPEHCENLPLLAHERLHGSEQWKQLVIVWWLRYLLSRSFRKAAEVRAYKLQILLGGCTEDQAATWLSTNYRLGISFGTALYLLEFGPATKS